MFVGGAVVFILVRATAVFSDLRQRRIFARRCVADDVAGLAQQSRDLCRCHASRMTSMMMRMCVLMMMVSVGCVMMIVIMMIVRVSLVAVSELYSRDYGNGFGAVGRNYNGVVGLLHRLVRLNVRSILFL